MGGAGMTDQDENPRCADCVGPGPTELSPGVLLCCDQWADKAGNCLVCRHGDPQYPHDRTEACWPIQYVAPMTPPARQATAGSGCYVDNEET